LLSYLCALVVLYSCLINFNIDPQKRKGGGVSAPVSVSAPAPAASPEVEDEKDEEKEAVVESPVAVLPVDKVDESTQTDGGSTHVIDIPIPEESEIVPAVSIVSDKALTDTVHSDKSIGDEDTLGASSEAQKEDEKSSANAGESEDGLQISKMDGVGTVVVTPSSANESSATDVPERSAPVTSVQPSVGREDDHDEWETVEVRTRGNRKKSGDRGSNGRFSSLQSHGKKNKNPRTSESRKRIAKRKMVRDILYSVLDSVDEQVRRRKQGSEPSPRPIPNAWGTLPAKKKGLPTTDQSSESAGAQPPANQRKDGATMRDVIMGKQSANVAKVSNSQQGSQRGYADRVRQRGLAEGAKKTRDKTTLVSPTAADQNTAPTVPETLSAVSTASAITETPSAKNTLQAPGLARSESSSSESIEATKPQSNSKQPSKEVTPSPPLPTLLSPGNANSATSSVASSLDAPHVVHHHSSFPGNENDVGYHLLRVCDRLTREIAQFMKRRDQALKIRRHERGLVLGALQDSLSVSKRASSSRRATMPPFLTLTIFRFFPKTLWPSGCKVEMYGSCATDLDLPSSDLDVVVCGLDESEQAAINAENQDIPGSPSESDGDVKADTNSIQSPEKAKPQSPPKSTVPQSQYAMPYPRMTTNAERVMTLAMELERQPWAVHVKAIPTASVPVIKILADPARLQGTAAGDGDWLVQQPQSQSTGDAPDQMPWRGADVVNGLLKVDITFEGPEHGGIGSTKFSTRVVEEFSEESGLPPDGTAEVQVLMVLKELLAQRRLNEPFSGGLSSYALLLLAISVVRERAIIRKELERVERQRKLVDAGGGNAVPRSGQADSTGIPSGTANTKDANFTADAKKQTKGSQKNDKSKSKSGDQNGEKSAGKGNTTASQRNDGGRKKNSAKGQTNQQSGEQKPSKGSSGQDATTLTRGGPASSSWASIAKKSSAPLSRKDSQDSPQSQTHTENKPPPVKKMSSFAEAVAKGNATSQENNDSNKSRTKKTDPKPKGADSKKGKGQDGAGNKKTDSKTQSGSEKKKIVSSLPVDAPVYEPMNVQSLNASSPTKQTASSLAEEPGSFFPQSFHDVIEVLCSGETTSGKLLMHFLLFYGQHFDSHSTAIDYSNTHERDPNMNNGYAVSSPYLQRRNTGNYDPMTGMYTVDPIVVYDPLVGAENNNVSRSCFAWSSIRWVFAQSYMTLSSAVEMSAGHQPGAGNNRNAPPAPPQGSGNGQSEPHPSGQQDASVPYASGHDESGNVIFDASTPLLELLLSF
jgi:DNA polymerase sigma